MLLFAHLFDQQANDDQFSNVNILFCYFFYVKTDIQHEMNFDFTIHLTYPLL